MYGELIQPSELQPHLYDADWALLDCRFDLTDPEKGEREYLEEHIPSAVYAHLDRDLSGPRTGKNGRHPIPSRQQMSERFSDWGIDGRVQVVAYDTPQGQMAARLWWMLRYLGHDRVAVLDGGLAHWKSRGYPVEKGRRERAPRKFTPRSRESMRIDVGELEPPGNRSRYLLIDARAPERFRGETELLDPVAGHIPGARNHPTAASLGEDGRFLPPNLLRERFEAILGDAAPDRVVSYCGSGVTACHNLLAMEIAGIRGAKLYPGSWSEWCARKSRPVATGSG